jgi:anti-sigma factor RsiW
MTCDDVRDRLPDRIDGALDPAAEAEVTSHLATCAACQRELAGLERTVAGLRALGDVHAPAGFVDRVLARARPEPWTHRLLRAVFLPLPRKLPLEAAAIVLVGILTVLLYRGVPDLERGGDQFAVREPAAPPVAAPVRPPAPSTPEAPPTKEDRLRAAPSQLAERAADRPRVTEETRASLERAAPQSPPQPPPAPAVRQETDTGALEELGKQKAAARDVQRGGAESTTGVAESTAQRGVPAPAGVAAAPPARGRPESAPPLMERTAPTDVLQRASRPDEAKETTVLKSRGQVRAAAPPGAMTAALTPPLRGVLRVGDRTASERAMRDLFGRLGVTATWDRPEPSVLTISAPKGVLAELLDGLRELGDLRMEPTAGEVPDRVTLVLRLAS